MTLIWVTGSPGAGKSSVCAALKAAGKAAFDADWEGFNFWADRTTGTVVDDPPDPVPPGWLDRYAWRINRSRVEAIADHAATNPVYLCGSVENERDVWDLFDFVICLVIDAQTLVQRLSHRSTNSFGRHPEELRAALAWNETAEATYLGFGATNIDATRPLNVVVMDVLTATSNFGSSR